MSTQPGTVVVGLDGSPPAERALTWAVADAVREGRTLTLLYAASLTATFGDATAGVWSEVQDVMRREGARILGDARELVGRLAPDLTVESRYEVNDPRQALLTASETASLIVIGSRGRGPVRSLLLGSVGVALARHARCAVLVHRSGTTQDARYGVVVAADARPESGPVLEAAFEQADLTGLPLTVLHCYGDVPFTASLARLETQRSVMEQEARVAVSEAIAGLTEKHPDVSVVVKIAPGSTRQALEDMQEHCLLFVVGTHRRSRARQLAEGSHATAVAVVEHATCPVMVVPVSAPGAAGPHEQD